MKLRPLAQISLLVGFLLLSGSGTGAQSIANRESRVTRHTLKNGLRFLMLERRTSPTISFHVFFNVGSVDDPAGQSGVAHMYEHMTFKGTSSVGTKNAGAESLLMKEQDQINGDWKSLIDYRERVAQVTPADIQRIATWYFTDSNKVLACIVPKPSSSTETQQAEDSKEIPVFQEKKAPEEKKAAQEEKPKSQEDQKKAAQELWQKALAAEGGLDALKAVKTRVTTGQASVITPYETLNGPMTTVVAYPDKISRQFTIGRETLFRTLVKEDLWIFTTKARQITMIAGALKPGHSNAEGVQLRMLLEADPVAFFVLGSDSSVEKTSLDPPEGMPGLKVKLPTGHVFNAYFNPKTFLLERLIYSVQYYGETTLKYSDFRPVIGIPVPFKMEIFRGSAKTEEQLISDVKLNGPVPEDTFRPPQ